MAEAEPSANKYDNVSKMMMDLNKDLERMLEEMEKISVQATWMAYDMVVIRTNPVLAESVRRLDDAFLKCKEEIDKKWQDVVDETEEKP